MPDERTRIGGIALLGEPGAGKTTIAAALATRLHAERLSFADGLRQEVATMIARAPGVTSIGLGQRARHGIVREMLDERTKDDYRPLLQVWGMFRRKRNVDYWANKVRLLMNPKNVYVVDDCRFPNEEALLRSRGFVFIRLGSGITTRALVGAQAEHESDQHWRKFDALGLSYEPGPSHQAQRIVDLITEYGTVQTDG